MRTRHLFLSTITLAAISLSLQGEAKTSSTSAAESSQLVLNESACLRGLMERYFEDLQSESPEFATYVGKTRAYNDRWSDHTEKAYNKSIELRQKYLKALQKIDVEKLSSVDRINYRLLEKSCLDAIEGHKYEMYYMPLDQLSGIPLDVEHVLQTMPRDTKEDYNHILARLFDTPKLIDQTIALLEKGVEKGLTQPQIVLHTLPECIAKMTPDDIEESVFFQPFTAFPETFTERKQKAYVKKAKEVIRKQVYPAYKKLHAYLESTYIPACRQTIGASDLPNGAEWYAYCVRRMTTTNLTPQEIHAMGLAEVKRIRAEMQAVIDESGFKGSIDEYFHYLHTSPEFYYSDAESLLNGYREITSSIDGQLSKLFGRLPKLPYEVVPIPAHAEAGQIGAYYMRGSITSGRPGRFFVNTFNIGSRPKWQMESLSLHEAVPGHHFQISLAQEIEGLPEFRKYTGYTAYIEGWGLYSESLGLEFGLNRTAPMKMGRLIEEIWRAVRLVVDTGMHSLGWSRQQAIDYFMAQTGMKEHEVTTEIDRYIVWPGQALAYKVGEMSIKRWRQEAKEAFEDKFDIRAFHDTLLEQGALPLDLCEEQMHAWMKQGTK